MPRLKDGYVRKPTGVMLKQNHYLLSPGRSTWFRDGPVEPPSADKATLFYAKSLWRTWRNTGFQVSSVHCCDLVVSTHLTNICSKKCWIMKPQFFGGWEWKNQTYLKPPVPDLGCLLLANHLLDQMTGDARPYRWSLGSAGPLLFVGPVTVKTYVRWEISAQFERDDTCVNIYIYLYICIYRYLKLYYIYIYVSICKCEYIYIYGQITMIPKLEWGDLGWGCYNLLYILHQSNGWKEQKSSIFLFDSNIWWQFPALRSKQYTTTTLTFPNHQQWNTRSHL